MVMAPDLKLLKELPVIRRARDFHLYDNGGRRFLDLYLNGGRAILGHRPDKLSLELKNTLSRGVYAEYPSHEEKKLLKAARALWGEMFPQIGYYRDPLALMSWFRQNGIFSEQDEIADPAAPATSKVSLWRPWLPLQEEVRYALPVLPLPGMERGIILCSRDNLPLPEGESPSPVIAAGLTRCLWSLKSRMDRPEYFSGISEEVLPGFEGWTRRGPYLMYNGTKEEYTALFRKKLEAGILIPPDPALPAILPGELTTGDLKILKKNF